MTISPSTLTQATVSCSRLLGDYLRSGVGTISQSITPTALLSAASKDYTTTCSETGTISAVQKEELVPVSMWIPFADDRLMGNTLQSVLFHSPHRQIFPLPNLTALQATASPFRFPRSSLNPTQRLGVQVQRLWSSGGNWVGRVRVDGIR